MSKPKSNPQIETALRLFAAKMVADPDSYSQEDGKILDRALRSCPGVIDIDVVWVMWQFHGESRGWITDKELVFKKGKYVYPQLENNCVTPEDVDTDSDVSQICPCCGYSDGRENRDDGSWICWRCGEEGEP